MSPSSSLNELQTALRDGTLTAALVQQSVAQMPPAELAELLRDLCQQQQNAAENQAHAAGHALLLVVAAAETQLLQQPPRSESLLCAAIEKCYVQLPADSPHRGGLLRILAAAAGAAELALLARLLAADPPSAADASPLALSPLFRRKKFDPAPLFPPLLETLVHPQVAPAALDLMNFLTRSDLLEVHPAAGRSQQLGELLGAMVGRLMVIEERREVPDAPTQQQVREGVALVVSLCDALALVGDSSLVGKLRQALGVTHRRIHTEAAYALAKLGEEEGPALLLALAAEPSARLRVLAYAKELDILSQLDPQYQTPQAIAEAELAVWLAEPLQMGMPPHAMELVDQREMYWPGYDDPVECYLFRYSYEFPAGQLSNVAIAGPLTMGFSADMGNLPAETIYAAFAGWQAEHPDIRELPYDSLSGPSERVAHRYYDRLVAQAMEEIQPVFLGQFFEQSVLVAEARREGVGGIALVDEVEIDWWPTQGKPRALGPREIYSIYKGKRLLQAFND